MKLDTDTHDFMKQRTLAGKYCAMQVSEKDNRKLGDKTINKDSYWKFDHNITNIGWKANRKLNVLDGMSNFLSFEKECVLLKALVE